MKSAFVAVAIFAVLLLYAWTATQGFVSWSGNPQNTSLLNLQVAAFHEGHVVLSVKPDAELLRAANPYDPETNRSVRLLDAVLFRGRYYTYFGPAPLVLVMWPWLALTGTPIPPILLAGLFASLAFGFQSLLLISLTRQWFSRTPPWMLALILIVVGGATLVTPLLRVSGTFQIPVLSGLCFASASFYFLFLCLRSGTVNLRWLGATSVASGLAVASRLNLLPAAVVMLALPFGLNLFSEPRPGKMLAGLTALAPFAVILGALAFYNVARFGSPFEFGNTFTLIEVDWATTKAFSINYLPTNLYYYFCSWPRLSWTFPFFLESADLPASVPSGYLSSYVDRVAGFLTFYPFVWLTGLLPKNIFATGPSGSRHWQLSIAGYFGVLTLTLGCFVGASARYQAELALPLVLLASITLLGVGEKLVGVQRLILHSVTIVLSIWSLAANFFISCDTGEILVRANPAQYRRVAVAANALTAPLAQRAGWGPRVARLAIKFPRDKVGRLEPLWVHGRAPEADFLYVFYPTPTTIQLGFESMGRGGPVSDLIPINSATVHQMEVLAGPFFPPADHPLYPRTDATGDDLLTHLLRVKVDGEVVLDAKVNFHRGRERSVWGTSPEETAFGQRFTGAVFELNWRKFNLKETKDWYAPEANRIALKIVWPLIRPAGDQPILSIGAKNAGQMVFARFGVNRRIQIGFSDENGQATLREIAEPGRDSQIVVQLPALNIPSAVSPAGTTNHVVISLDSGEILNFAVGERTAGPHAISMGHNSILRSGVAENFSGTVTLVPGGH